MKLHVRFFALARDRAGVSEMRIEVPDRATVDSAATLLAERFPPSFADLLPRVAFAVNMSYVDRNYELKDGDELAVIPPVSGG